MTTDMNKSAHFTYLRNENQQPPGSDWCCESNITVIWSIDDSTIRQNFHIPETKQLSY